MIYIDSDDKIMMKYDANHNLKEVANDTGFVPLSVHCDVILMDNHKLYHVNISCGTLSAIQLETREDYIVDVDNFTDKFARINLEYYRITHTNLYKITIAAKNVFNILIERKIYFYLDINNKLLCCSDTHDECANNKSILIIDSDVDLLLFCCYCYTDGKYHMCYSKANKIICCKILISQDNTVKEFYDINYDGSTIIKKIDNVLLNSDRVLLWLGYIWCSGNHSSFCVTKKLLNVNDFNINYNMLIYLKNNGQIYENSKKYIGSGCFKKLRNRVKSAATVC